MLNNNGDILPGIIILLFFVFIPLFLFFKLISWINLSIKKKRLEVYEMEQRKEKDNA